MKKIVTFALIGLGLTFTACSSDDSAEKADETATDTTETVEETAEEAAPALKIELDAFKDAASATAETLPDGTEGVKMSGVVDGAGYAQCGIADGDVVKSIDGAAVPVGREGIQSLIKACSEGKAVVVDRGGEETTLGGM